MADNYLERRMEDLKSGRLRPQMQAKSAGPRKGHIEFPFPARRVLVVGGTRGLPLDIARMFLRSGCKVAIFDTDKTGGDTLAYNEGIRYYNIEDPSAESITSSFTNLLQAWRDVDIIIMAKFQELVGEIVRVWTSHRDIYPVPFGYGGRMILLYEDGSDADHSAPLKAISDKLIPYRITTNIIKHSTEKNTELRDPIRLTQTLVLPGNDFLSTHVISYQ